jgi:hypothetical protein
VRSGVGKRLLAVAAALEREFGGPQVGREGRGWVHAARLPTSWLAPVEAAWAGSSGNTADLLLSVCNQPLTSSTRHNTIHTEASCRAALAPAAAAGRGGLLRG